MILLPYRVDTLLSRSPWANLVIVVLTVAVSIAAFFDGLSENTVRSMVLQGWHVGGLFGHMLLHADWMHLIGNMLMLFIFGNAVCGVMGQVNYTLLYLTVGLGAAAAHLLADGSPALGASGAVCGVMGVYLAIYPINQVTCFWMWMVRVGTFEVSGWLLIGGYFILDLLGSLGGGGDIAYWAHIGGTVAGFVIGLTLLKFNLIDLGEYDNPTALDYFTGNARR